MFIHTRLVFRLCFLASTCSPCHIFKAYFRSVSRKILSSQYYRPPDIKKKLKPVDFSAGEESESSLDDPELDKFLQRSLIPVDSGHQVFVIQPFIKWGGLKKRNTTPQLQLLESVTLIKTLRQWEVVDKKLVSLQYVRKNTVFGPGVLKDLMQYVKNCPKTSAVFISLNTLSLKQQTELEMAFEVPVFDRYSIIMHIFKQHAQTREAKLQIQLAQLPYLWTVLRGIEGCDLAQEKWGVSGSSFGGSRFTLLSRRKEAFRKKAAQLKQEILELREQRALFRQKRKKHEIPVVAVIGYTNAGKTSLIKALTGKKSLQPQDYLFATLDVTSHLGVLPCGLKTYFIDTLGFICDIPTYLIESFVTTLEDAVLADVIVHVRDVSHPDTIAQNDKVIEILNSLNIPEETLKNIITVGNKIDLVKKKNFESYKDMILVSSTNFTGIEVLRAELEKKILQTSDLIRIMIRVETGSPEYSWLQESATIVKETPDEKNNQFMFMDTIISPVNLAKFKSYFIKNYKR